MSALKFWLWLSTKQSLNDELTARLIDGLGSPEIAFYTNAEELKTRFGLNERQLKDMADKDFDRAERILELCEHAGVKLLTMQDAVYPERLRALHSPPSVLYYRGHLPAMDEEAAFGIVGTRAPTAYGEAAAMQFGYHLAKSGMLIVSGMAKGIDGIAQRGALRAGRPTIAVLGNGPDIVYPAENRPLYEDIVAAGAVVSEYPPGMKGDRKTFPRRNRIISGLSLGVLIVEAPAGSGALITADHALEQDRDIFAVPGSINSPESAGCHRLIREGAVLAACPEDVLREYRALYAHKLIKTPSDRDLRPSPPAAQRPAPRRPRSEPQTEPRTAKAPEKIEAVDLTERLKAFPPERQMILYTVAAEARSPDDIIRLTGMDTDIVLSELSMLELEGILQKTPGGRFIMLPSR